MGDRMNTEQTVTSGHFTLTPEQRRFSDLLANYPRIARYWDFDKRDCDVRRLETDLPVFSHGEQIMARFFASVWLGDDTMSFDVIDAVKSLDDRHRQIIAQWLGDPFFP